MRIVNGAAELLALAGVDLGVGPWWTVRQADIDDFARSTRDDQWIHIDPVRAASFGGPIAHGYLVLSLTVAMFRELVRIDGVGPAVNYGLDRLRFPAPVRVDSRIRLHASIGDVRDLGAQGAELRRTLTVQLEGSEKPACVAESIVRFPDANR